MARWKWRAARAERGIAAARPATGRVLFEPGRDQLADPAPERVRVDVPLHVPQLASLAHHPVAEDAVAVADEARVPLEVEVRPLVLQVGLREGALAVQRR